MNIWGAMFVLSIPIVMIAAIVFAARSAGHANSTESERNSPTFVSRFVIRVIMYVGGCLVIYLLLYRLAGN